MKIRKVIIGALTMAVMVVSFNGISAFANENNDDTVLPIGVDEVTFSLISSIDDVLNILEYKYENSKPVSKMEIGKLVALLEEYNSFIIYSKVELTQVHVDIIWKTDYIISHLNTKYDLSDVYKEINKFNIWLNLYRPVEEIKAVG